jgi:hypothetical protein
MLLTHHFHDAKITSPIAIQSAKTQEFVMPTKETSG